MKKLDKKANLAEILVTNIGGLVIGLCISFIVVLIVVFALLFII